MNGTLIVSPRPARERERDRVQKNSNDTERTPGQRRRAGKTCHHCHARKIRCDVQQRGVPCSNCADQSISACIVRRRKNARQPSGPNGVSHNPPLNIESRQPQDSSFIGDQNEPDVPVNLPQPLGQDVQLPPVNDHIGWNPPNDDTWPGSERVLEASPVGDSVNAPSSGVDFSYLTDLEDVFAYTDWTFFPPTQPGGSGFHSNARSIQGDTNPLQVPSGLLDEGQAFTDSDRIGLGRSFVLTPTDHDFLEGQGCFKVPPTPILREILRYYFQYVHPNLPILDERRFESVWTQDDYRLDGVSLLLFRAILFAGIHFLDLNTLALLGFSGKREARYACYRQAKLVYDFDLEQDPFTNAQACLILTYYGPGYNRLRVNASWLTQAARFARIARADTFYQIQDPIQRSSLKRLWWGVLFRDRILSGGLRWNTQVDLDPILQNSEYFLALEDFSEELGKSRVHDRATQTRIVDIVNSTCSLICELTPAMKIVYGHERISERMVNVRSSGPDNLKEIQRCLDNLRRWYDRTIRMFPEPISLDDTHESVCIYANMMFCYYSSAVFALNFHRILIYETIPNLRDRIPLEACQESSVTAINDLERRTQEFVQTRLARYLPISASAYLSLPLLLQAVNVSAVRGTELEAGEARRLDVFTRVLKSQEQCFDGSDFCTETLSNIVAYVQQDEKFLEWIAVWRDESQINGRAAAVSDSTAKQSSRVKLGWASLLRKKPRLCARLLLHLDFALCTGTAPREDDLLPELLSPK